MTTANESTTAAATVAASEADSSLVAEIVASLPVSFATAEQGGAADVVELPGTCGWVASARRAVENGGARAIVVTDPAADDPETIEDLANAAAATGIAVLLAQRFASNAVIPALRDARPDALDDPALVQFTVTADQAPRDLLLEALGVLRALGYDDIELTDITTTATTAIVTGHTGDTLVSGLCTRSTIPASATVRIGAADRTVDVSFPDGKTAVPATASVADAASSVRLPTIYETPYRTVWGSISGADATTFAAALRGFAVDVRSATR